MPPLSAAHSISPFGSDNLSLEKPGHIQTFLIGASTYTGNGADFIVKSMAKSCGKQCPGLLLDT